VHFFFFAIKKQTFFRGEMGKGGVSRGFLFFWWVFLVLYFGLRRYYFLLFVVVVEIHFCFQKCWVCCFRFGGRGLAWLLEVRIPAGKDISASPRVGIALLGAYFLVPAEQFCSEWPVGEREERM
jgi:hypothetical protein